MIAVASEISRGAGLPHQAGTDHDDVRVQRSRGFVTEAELRHRPRREVVQHDIGLSGWYSLFVLIPSLGSLILLAFSLIPSQKRDNRWGPVPENVAS